MNILKKKSLLRAFTIVEVLVTIVILVAIMFLTALMVSSTQKTIRTAKNDASQFRDARRAFETITNRLSQATLNTYWDYDDPAEPTSYIRQSELHFVSGNANDLLDSGQFSGHGVFFNAPFGFAGSDAIGGNNATDPYRDLESLLNAWGFFVSYSEDPKVPPFIESKSWYQKQARFRLFEFRQPSERLSVYTTDLRKEKNRSAIYNWFRTTSDPTGTNTRVVADNILALIISPRKSVAANSTEKAWDIAPDYLYDSRELQWGTINRRTDQNHNQLPPLMEVTMVAVDNRTWKIYQQKYGTGTPDFGINSLFKKAANYQTDIETLEDTLNQKGLDHRIFSATVGMRTAKWSEDITK